MSITKKKQKLTKLGTNAYYSELMLILLNVFQPQKLMNKTTKTETLFLKKEKKKKKTRGIRKKKLVVYLLELIQVMQKEVMIQIMKLAKYRYLPVNLKKKNKRKRNQNKRTRRRNEKNKISINISECIGCPKMFYQIIENEKHTIKNKAGKNWKKDWNNVLFGV